MTKFENSSKTYEVKIMCRTCPKLYITVTEENDIFIKGGKVGTCTGTFINALARTISLALRHGANSSEIAETLVGLRCEQPNVGVGVEKEILSCADAIGKILVEEFGYDKN